VSRICNASGGSGGLRKSQQFRHFQRNDCDSYGAAGRRSTGRLHRSLRSVHWATMDGTMLALTKPAGVGTGAARRGIWDIATLLIPTVARLDALSFNAGHRVRDPTRE
jgi:hypothetical protein